MASLRNWNTTSRFFAMRHFMSVSPQRFIGVRGLSRCLTSIPYNTPRHRIYLFTRHNGITTSLCSGTPVSTFHKPNTRSGIELGLGRNAFSTSPYMGSGSVKVDAKIEHGAQTANENARHNETVSQATQGDEIERNAQTVDQSEDKGGAVDDSTQRAEYTGENSSGSADRDVKLQSSQGMVEGDVIETSQAFSMLEKCDPNFTQDKFVLKAKETIVTVSALLAKEQFSTLEDYVEMAELKRVSKHFRENVNYPAKKEWFTIYQKDMESAKFHGQALYNEKGNYVYLSVVVKGRHERYPVYMFWRKRFGCIYTFKKYLDDNDATQIVHLQHVNFAYQRLV